MKRISLLCQLVLLGIVGCSGPTAPVANTPSSAPETTSISQTENSQGTEAAPTDVPADATFVSLKVPNMH